LKRMSTQEPEGPKETLPLFVAFFLGSLGFMGAPIRKVQRSAVACHGVRAPVARSL
jgi:hypothetical protein